MTSEIYYQFYTLHTFFDGCGLFFGISLCMFRPTFIDVPESPNIHSFRSYQQMIF